MSGVLTIKGDSQILCLCFITCNFRGDLRIFMFIFQYMYF